ncbi:MULTISPECIES: DUF6090 family protein [Bizionia]|uniref:Uncharacterized protein n=1 Tax=Bizionia algoritergicola TaxID=291187 RepID=A0A5D0QR40_9FLAO|nr:MULTISPECIES: DUF6090 family protein [Bizionia]OBX22268.1 hypothetical protein BAA08_09245 [Bizionia sp. APA-3]TYB70838.1 hypothetical protein ES675_15115 [Bizionia algoritergicola]
MVSAIRRIRKRLLEQNRFKRYVLYAIGEIFLVVIGILLALQINTWSKENHNLKLEKTLLEDFKSDFIIQKELIIEQIDYEIGMMAQIDSALQFMSPNYNKATLPRKLHELTARRTFKANRATFNNMIASGSVNLISNTSLQNTIIRYFQRLDYVESVVNNNNLYMVDSNFGEFASNNALGFQIDETGKFVDTIDFTNEQRYLLDMQLRYRNGASKSIKQISTILLELTEELIQTIDAELKH